jgi:hypothetical protein
MLNEGVISSDKDKWSNGFAFLIGFIGLFDTARDYILNYYAHTHRHACARAHTHTHTHAIVHSRLR